MDREALNSLRATMRYYCCGPMAPLSPETMSPAHRGIRFLGMALDALESSSRSRRVDALGTQIRDATRKLEDVIESYVCSRSDGDHELEKVKQGITSFDLTATVIQQECSSIEKDLLEDVSVSSMADFVSEELVGLHDEYVEIRNHFTRGKYGYRAKAIVGMAGIGKTALALKLLQDPLVVTHFDRSLFVAVGQQSQFKRLAEDILARMGHQIDQIRGQEEQMLEELLMKSLCDFSYLIVVDDIWDAKLATKLFSLIYRCYNGSGILMTTRLENLAHYSEAYRMRFLNEEESWQLLCREVFKEDRCPSQLLKPGKKIAKNCEGLPLAILIVAKLLSKAEQTTDFWMKVADRENSVFEQVEEAMSKTLFPSYDYLPKLFKPCFLYMGIFPPKCQIRASKLLMLWNAEGLFDLIWDSEVSGRCLDSLVSNNVVKAGEPSSSGKMKTCSLHFAFRYLCIKEAQKVGFLHVMNKHVDSQGIKCQRRLCVLNNSLFGIKGVHNSMASVSMCRSLLCTGSYYRYSVPVYFKLRLLKVLDLLTIRLYKFPTEVVELVMLRYVALTCNGTIPGSISKLCILQYLIVGRHWHIKSNETPMYLPVEIWDMKELQHVQFIGGDLLESVSSAVLNNLTTLLGVTASSCTKGVLERIPFLKRLGVLIELPPNSDEPMSCFDHLSHLCYLETLKCVIVNPNLRTELVPLPTKASVFPNRLKKLTLSGFGYPWKAMDMIALLPYLKVLKLLCYAFRGPWWTTSNDGFLQLEFLHIEDTDLEFWEVGGSAFQVLARLTIKHCYKLKMIPRELKSRQHLKIERV